MARRTLAVLVVLLAAVALASPKKYRGPECLGPFCLGKRVYPRSLFAQLGAAKEKSDTYCYESSERGLYLRFQTESAMSGAVVSVMLSDFRNCLHSRRQHTGADLLLWKTPEGIGIGSSEEDVLKAYGKPIDRWRATPEQIAGLMDWHTKGDDVPKPRQAAEWMLAYGTPNSNDLRSAGIGLRNGKVSYIWLSESE